MTTNIYSYILKIINNEVFQDISEKTHKLNISLEQQQLENLYPSYASVNDQIMKLIRY